MAGDNHSTEDELVRFEEKYARILSEDPSSVTFIFLAQVLHKQGKVDKAIKVLINGLKYNRNSVTGRFLLGKIYYDRWLIEQAKREFNAVIELAPDNLAACKMLVQIHKSEEAYGKALALLKTSSTYHPNDASIACELMEIEALLSSAEKKEKDFLNARDSIRKTFDGKSTEELESAVKQHDRELVTETIADIYIAQGLYEKACGVLEKLHENDPENVAVMKKLAQSRLYLVNKSAGFVRGE